jgi:hypothetical protein
MATMASPEIADALVTLNPRAILNNEEIPHRAQAR